MEEHGLKNKFIYQLAISVSQVLMPFISYPYITRVLGPANLGIINYVDFLAQVFIIFAAFGIPFYAAREIARARYDMEARSKLIKEMVLLQAVFSLTATSIFVIVTFNSWGNNTLLFILAMINILTSAFSFDWYIQGVEAFRFSAIRTILIRFFMLVAFFIFIKQRDDYFIYPLIFTIGFVVIAIINSSKVFLDNQFSKQLLDFKQHLKPLWHFFLTSSAISIYVFFDTVILQYLTHNETAVGYYTTVLKLVKICQVVILTISTVLMPRMSYLVSTGNMKEIKKYLDKLLNLVITIGFPAGVGIILLAPEILNVVTGKEFLPAVPTLRIIAFLPFIIGLSNIFCFQCLVPFKKEKKFLIAVVTGSIISLSLNFILIPHLREQGAAYANLITEIIITLISGYFAYKIMRISVTGVTGTIICTAIFVPLIFLIKYLFSGQLVILLLSIISCSLVYFLLQDMVFKNSTAKEIKNYISQIVHTKK